MISFRNDYSEGAHPSILAALQATNLESTPGYGRDHYCEAAAEAVRARFACPQADVHFMLGGTLTNLTLIAAALRPWEAVIAADTAHICVHESASIEAAGHKICAAPPTDDGKLTPEHIRQIVEAHKGGDDGHMVVPRMVYLSDATELGTIYTRAELAAISETCRELGLYLYLDGARMGAALVCAANDLQPEDFAKYCDAFYIGGTKNGLLFGEALVLVNDALKPHFRNALKQRGGMLAKGRLLGVQFEALLEGDLYFEISRHADGLADKIRRCLQRNHVPMYVENETNQIFPILPDAVLAQLQKTYVFTEQCRVDDAHRAVRICTSWATGDENVDRLCRDLDALLKAE